MRYEYIFMIVLLLVWLGAIVWNIYKNFELWKEIDEMDEK